MNIHNIFILTFGYGNRPNYDTLLEYCQKFNVSYLIDVREKPRAWSRKWYGTEIKKMCEQQGINYLSEIALGNISGTNHWISPQPEKVEQILQEIALKTQSKTVLLLCAEMDYNKCHRTEVAIELHKLTRHPIEHLL
ncbi:MAG TPA: DUF488 domain-containing protein [Allocoleopsis sp.]